MNDEPKRYPLSVIYWEGRVHCISLNDYRIASGKAWGGGDPAATWDVSIAELCRAIPELARLVALGNAALAEDALTEERDAALERVKALEAGLVEGLGLQAIAEFWNRHADYMDVMSALHRMIDRATTTRESLALLTKDPGQ